MDADVALQRLDAEDLELKEEIKSRVEKRSGVDERVSEAEATLTEAEQQFSELTTALADLTAKRNQLEANVRTHRDRLARLDQEIANVAAEEQKLAEETGGFGDLDEPLLRWRTPSRRWRPRKLQPRTAKPHTSRLARRWNPRARR